MEIRRWSKSLDALFRMCPFCVQMYHVMRFTQPFRESASHGNWGHAAFRRICTGESNLTAEMNAAPVPWLAEALQRIVTDDPSYKDRGAFEYEKRVYLNRSGRLLSGQKAAAFAMILDRVGCFDWDVFVDDVKFSHPDWEITDPYEVAAYLFAAYKLYPKANRFTFRYLYARSGNIVAHEVDRSAARSFWDVLNERLEEMDRAEPTPNPGAHCENWYGSGPCQFAGRECPVAVESLPVALAQVPATETLATEIIRLPREKAAAAAFMGILHGMLPQDALTPQILGLAYEATKQISAGNRTVMKALRTALAEQDITFPYGDAEFGLIPSATIAFGGDSRSGTTAALQAMLNAGWGAPQLARYVTVNTTALKKPRPGDEAVCRHIVDNLAEQNRTTIGKIADA